VSANEDDVPVLVLAGKYTVVVFLAAPGVENRRRI
jgi:hypothetical protein